MFDASSQLVVIELACSCLCKNAQSGVIWGFLFSSLCKVNTDDVMNRQTGHFTAKTSGDYFITFTANLVSVNSQAIWCALYKQSSGKEGWEVLGEKKTIEENFLFAEC